MTFFEGYTTLVKGGNKVLFDVQGKDVAIYDTREGSDRYAYTGTDHTYAAFIYSVFVQKGYMPDMSGSLGD